MPSLYRRRWLWSAFALLVLIALGAMTVLSVTAWRLDALETEARHAAAVEENLRLALWRIDTAWAPLIAHESVRQPTDAVEVPWVGGAVLGRVEWLPGTGLIGGESLEEAGEIDFVALWQRLPPASHRYEGFTDTRALVIDDSESSLPVPGIADFQQRNQAINANNFLAQQISNNSLQRSRSTTVASPLQALWVSGQLLLARRTQHGSGEVLEATLLDWKRLRTESLRLIADLLPHATLQPVEGLGTERSPDMLASLPVRLVPGELSVPGSAGRLSVAVTLAAAWTGVLLAGILGAVLLHGVLQLSERRAAFVTAVTHELRTPLTTFQLYTEMLCSGMITSEADRRSYLQTLRGEALRLNHLVDNVLAYARLERGRAVGPLEVLTVGELLDRIRPRLQELAARSDMPLSIQSCDTSRWLRVNVSVVEQILLNLVDNTCKYAAGAADRRILISTAGRSGAVELRVRDFGPGLPVDTGWPRPFSKSAHQAAESSPGVGLGLALSRRLAHQLGGSLHSERPADGPGACLVLTLPCNSVAGENA